MAQSRGTCAYCGKETTKGSINKHLEGCTKRLEVMTAAKGTPETLLHLRVQATNSDFWLNLEMRGATTLSKLDGYLRAIWLECCGHMSQFGDYGREIGKSRKAEAVFVPGATLLHLYDFGTTSETLMSCLGVRTGIATTKHPIALLARNVLPPTECVICQKPAQWYNPAYEWEGEFGALCDDHKDDNPHTDEFDASAIYNSPRMGVCGYDGPAAPPY